MENIPTSNSSFKRLTEDTLDQSQKRYKWGSWECCEDQCKDKDDIGTEKTVIILQSYKPKDIVTIVKDLVRLDEQSNSPDFSHTVQRRRKNTSLEFKKLDSSDLFSTKECMTIEDWIKFINKSSKKTQKLAIKDKKSDCLLKSIFKDNFPPALWVHVWLILSGGFLHLEKSKESPKTLMKSVPKDEYFDDFEYIGPDKPEVPPSIIHIDDIKPLTDEKMKSQIEKDLQRTIMPYDKYIKDSFYSPSSSTCSKFQLPDLTLSTSEMNKFKLIDENLKTQARKILEKYAVLDPEIGYAQGMHSIALAIIYNCFIAKHKFEDLDLEDHLSLNITFELNEPFLIFHGIMKHLNLREALKIDFRFLNTKIDKFGEILKKRLPSVYTKLTNYQTPLISYFASFYLTIFLHLAPLQLSHRILSAFMLIEYDIIDHLLMGLFTVYQDKILKIKNLAELIKFVQKEMFYHTLETDGLDNFFLITSLECFTNGANDNQLKD